MCEMGSTLQNLSLENISLLLVDFYYGVIEKQNVSEDISANKKTLGKLRKTYSNKLRRDDPCSISFDSVDVRSAYLFQYCPSFTLAMASHLLMLVKNDSQQQLQSLALGSNLAICCLGGGPGTDVVAICKVLQYVRKCMAPTASNPLMVDATVVDVEPGWSSTAQLVVDSLPGLVDPSVVQIGRFRFIKHDFTQSISEDIATSLAQSNVITMNKFLSALHGPRNPVDRTDIIKDTWNHIPEGSILFLMDSSGWNRFDEMVRTVDSLVQAEPVYGPAKKTSRMSKSSKTQCRSLSAAIYGQQCCTAHSSNKAAAWLKAASAGTS